MISYCLGLMMAFSTGYLLIKRLNTGRLNPMLHCVLGLSLGLGFVGILNFYIHILLNCYNRSVPVIFTASVIALLWFLPYKEKIKSSVKKQAKTKQETAWAPAHYGWILLTLGVLAIPLIIGAHTFPLGGWDAWSCWNLKAKFVFLGHEHWKRILEPDFWRTNTQYPLLWPLINVFFWDLSGRFDQAVPMLNSLCLALLTAGVLILGLMELTGKLLPSLAGAILATALPFGVTMFISQYSDSLLGLYLLCAFTCLLLAEKYNQPKLRILSMVFLGIMAFTKNEGLVAAFIAASGILWMQRSHKKELKNLAMAFLIALLPSIIFALWIAPKNATFINGLASTEKPMTVTRVVTVIIAPLVDLISLKWNGFWLLVMGGLILGGKKLWQSTLGLMGMTVILYIGAVLGFYAVNTFYEIHWWIANTFARIVFALVPTVILWIAAGLAFKDA